MDNSIWGMLNDAEQELLRDTEPEAIADLGEDDLAALHDRIRRARNKYAKLYRRRAAAEVTSSGARAKGHARHVRTLVKAEAFEEALERVSTTLARAAKASAKALRKERLAMAGKEKTPAKTKPKGKSGKGGKAGTGAKGAKGSTKHQATTGKAKGTAKGKAKAKTPISKKASASARGAKKQFQAKRDAR